MVDRHSNSNVFIPREYDIFSGLDVDKTSIAVTFRDHGEMVKSMKIPYNAKHLVNYIHKHYEGRKVAFVYEAGPTGYGLHDELVAEGYPCLVVAPSMVPSAPGERVKTNRLDSNKLCTLLRGGQLESIHVPSGSYRQLRHLTQLRDTFVRHLAATKCRIKALLLFEGIAFPVSPQASRQWTLSGIHKLKTMSLTEEIRFKLDQLLMTLEFTKTQVLKTQREIRRFCKEDPELSRCIEYLTSIPGIGWIVGSHLLARIGDWRMLENVRQIAGFLGLAPRENSTGEKVKKGTITRTGDARLRGKLIQSAWSAIRQDPELNEFYRRVYQRHPQDQAARKAIVAVARKLTTRIYTVLKEQRMYEIRGKAKLAC